MPPPPPQMNVQEMLRPWVTLVHSALTDVNKNTTFDFNNALVNVEINIKINKCCRRIVHS